jgi:hypothetical protein
VFQKAEVRSRSVSKGEDSLSPTFKNVGLRLWKLCIPSQAFRYNSSFKLGFIPRTKYPELKFLLMLLFFCPLSREKFCGRKPSPQTFRCPLPFFVSPDKLRKHHLIQFTCNRKCCPIIRVIVWLFFWWNLIGSIQLCCKMRFNSECILRQFIH